MIFFKTFSDEEIDKAIMKSPTKSCLLDLWPTFFKDCLDILLLSIKNYLIVLCLKVLFLLVSKNILSTDKKGLIATRQFQELPPCVRLGSYLQTC